MRGPVEREVGAVVIGRNEGARLVGCIRSLRDQVGHVIYVDSASRDESVAVAKSLGAEVVELDPARPLSAARARNEGARALTRSRPEIAFVFFIDGDCELAPGFVDEAVRTIAGSDEIAVVCGRRRERWPEASVYNRLCDIEWAGSAGDVDACGGDALMRLRAFDEAGGFDPALIAGEEPDLCLRLRRLGYRVRRIDRDMSWHDAAITRFSEWWRRAERAGHAFTEGAVKHREGEEGYWVKEALRPWIYGGLVPASALIAAAPSFGLSAGLLIAYPISGARAYASFRSRGFERRDSAVAAAYCVLGRFPELVGSARFLAARFKGKARSIIEYKGAQT